MSPYSINNGFCVEFAESVVENFPDAQLGTFDLDHSLYYGHFWIIYDKKYYDAEAPYGVDFLFELPIFQKRIKSMN